MANKGIKRIIYSGKLGTLNHSLIPNKSIATGNTTILPNGQTISWTNLFENISSPQVFHGKHITIPSVLQETTEWVRKNKDMIDFVDPEIGHMALAAYRANIAFSYIHIISDNLSKKYSFNLSNERIAQVIADRSNLLKTIGNEIIKL